MEWDKDGTGHTIVFAKFLFLQKYGFLESLDCHC